MDGVGCCETEIFCRTQRPVVAFSQGVSLDAPQHRETRVSVSSDLLLGTRPGKGTEGRKGHVGGWVTLVGGMITWGRGGSCGVEGHAGGPLQGEGCR